MRFLSSRTMLAIKQLEYTGPISITSDEHSQALCKRYSSGLYCLPDIESSFSSPKRFLCHGRTFSFNAPRPSTVLLIRLPEALTPMGAAEIDRTASFSLHIQCRRRSGRLGRSTSSRQRLWRTCLPTSRWLRPQLPGTTLPNAASWTTTTTRRATTTSRYPAPPIGTEKARVTCLTGQLASASVWDLIKKKSFSCRNISCSSSPCSVHREPVTFRGAYKPADII